MVVTGYDQHLHINMIFLVATADVKSNLYIWITVTEKNPMETLDT